MRILIASPYLPWPLNSGGNAGVFSTLRCLAGDHQYTFVCLVWDENGMRYAKELQAQLPLVKIRAVPCGDARSALQPKPGAILRAARRCVRSGRRLFSPPPALQPAAPLYPFNPLPHEFLTVLGDELAKGVDLFQAEFAEMMPLGVWLPPEIAKVFVHHQIHFVYAKRFLEARGKNSYVNYLDAIMRTQEMTYLQSFHAVITLSDEDRRTLLPFLQPERLFTSPLPIPSDVGIACDVSADFDNRFVFVAPEQHSPNRDGLQWLLAEVWPEIRRQLPSSTLDVVGEWSKAGKATHSAPGVNFVGFVKDLPAVFRSSIMLLPLRIGSGIRMKLLAALAQGVPTVSTSIGCEGLLVSDGADILIRDDPRQFAAAAVSLAQDPDLRMRLALAGRDTVSRHYSQEEVRRRRNEIYAAVLQSAGSECQVNSPHLTGNNRI